MNHDLHMKQKSFLKIGPSLLKRGPSLLFIRKDNNLKFKIFIKVDTWANYIFITFTNKN